MIYKKLSLLILFFATGLLTASAQKSPQDMDRFIDALMKKMTTEEKIGQLNLPVTGEITTGQAKSSDIAGKIKKGEVGGLFNLKGVKNIREVQKLAVENSRLGIPLLFGMDVIHGYETVFPIPLALSCSWDMEAIEKSARIAAIESSADGICWTFSPMVDICRDARWGRVSEGNGEDPFLGSAIAQAMIRGYQGKDMSANNEIMACVKHFALYGAGEAGRDYNTVDMSRNRMFNEYFPPYKAAVEAGVGSAMTSFNEIDGVPATANHWLLTDVLRNQWGFDGFVVTDYTAISEMIDHGIGDLQEVSARALTAGTDMDMVADGFIGTLEKSLKEGKVTEADIDKACRRILEAKYKLGLFANPYKYCDVKRAEKEVFTPEHRSIARQIATETFVLLKNQDNLLPLQRKGNIALIGPLANTRANMPGTWSVAATADRYSTLLEGFKNAVGSKANILYAQGSNLMYDADYQTRATMFGRELPRGNDQELLDEALKVAAQADVIVAALGESSEMSGESSSRSELEMPDAQRHLLEALLKTGKPVVLVLFSGRPVVLTWEDKHVPAILNVWFGGSEAADAIADVVFGDVCPSGKLTTTFPQNVGQRFRQPHLTDAGIGFRLFQNNSCAGVRHERSEDVIDILLTQRFDCPFGCPCQLLVDVDIGVIRRNIFIGNMDVLPGQPQDFTHTQRAGEGKVHCYIELAVRAFVQGKTDHIRRPDIPFRILRFREDHIVKGISCNDFPAYRLLKRTPQELDDLFNGLVTDISGNGLSGFGRH